MAPSLTDKLNHAKEVAKWKVDQQSRILKTQNKISDFERQVGRQKALLADRVYAQYQEKKIKNPEVTPICDEIAQLFKAVEEARVELEAIRNEQPPVLEESYSPGDVYSGLVCPDCGKQLSGKFCPDCGKEGVAPAVEHVHSESGLVCPECGKPVPVKFCVDCGVEGVPVVEEEAPAEKPEKAEKKAAKKASGLVCPKCGKELEFKFCNDCGVEGVPAEEA